MKEYQKTEEKPLTTGQKTFIQSMTEDAPVPAGHCALVALPPPHAPVKSQGLTYGTLVAAMKKLQKSSRKAVSVEGVMVYKNIEDMVEEEFPPIK